MRHARGLEADDSHPDDVPARSRSAAGHVHLPRNGWRREFLPEDDASKNRTELTFILEDEAPVAEILSAITAQGAKVHALRKTEPTLEDVFISMVGRGFE